MSTIHYMQNCSGEHIESEKSSYVYLTGGGTFYSGSFLWFEKNIADGLKLYLSIDQNTNIPAEILMRKQTNSFWSDHLPPKRKLRPEAFRPRANRPSSK